MKNEKKVIKEKGFFEKIILEIKKITFGEVLFILVLVTALILILGFIGKKGILSAYFGPITIKPIYYFDIAVRNGVFKYIYFAFIIALVYWLAKKITGHKFNVKTGVIAIALGFAIAWMVYLLPPYYLTDTEPLPGSFWPYPEDSEVAQINHAGCGDRVDFLFSPSSELALKEIPVIQAVKEKGIPINVYCIGDRWINDDILCRKKYGLNTGQGERLRDELDIKQINNRDPQLVIGCKYWIVARHNITETRDFICNRTKLC